MIELGLSYTQLDLCLEGELYSCDESDKLTLVGHTQWMHVQKMPVYMRVQ